MQGCLRTSWSLALINRPILPSHGCIQAGLEQFVDTQKRRAREMHGELASKEQGDE
ncbi:MAG: hypothetical protein K6346_08675 [Halothiobacillaceae bacterium]